MFYKRLMPTVLIVSIMCSAPACSQSYSSEISQAILAAPAADRDAATILGWDQDGVFKTLREGTNELVCISDNPEKDGFEVACYHRDLDPYMARGRELRASGKNGREIRAIRTQEVEAGTLSWPSTPEMLYIFTGDEGTFDVEAGTVVNPYLRYVVYVPYATAESTGLPTQPMAPGAPWIMEPGSHRAHIMIVPPKGQ